MCIFVIVLAGVAIIACWRMHKRIKELKAQLQKTPARGTDGRYKSRKA